MRGGNGLTKILPKGVLAGDPQRIAVKGLLLVKIGAHIRQKTPTVVVGLRVDGLEKLGVKNPVDQIIFVPKVVIKALPAHVAGLADVANADL